MMIKASFISKRRKFHGGEKNQNVHSEQDIISRLPDTILCHMLSFLPTKDAVGTSILSKRWHKVWTSVPCIEIADKSLDSLLPEDYPRVKYCFKSFVDRVLHLNDVSRLTKFSLFCYEYYGGYTVDEWISAAILRDIDELDLGLSPYHPRLPFPPSVFTIKNLVILRLTTLGGVVAFKVPEKVHLPCLKILHLRSIVLSKEDSIRELIDGCPTIDTLDIEIARCAEIGNTLFVRSSSLKSLRVHIAHADLQVTVAVDAANLERLDLKDDVKVEYDVINLSSLVEVRIHFCGTCSRRIDYGNKFLELLTKLSNTKYLFLSCEMMKRLEFARWDDLPLLHNVTHLELHTCDYSWSVLPALFECFPHLKTFVFHKEGSCGRKLRFRAPKCLMLYLEEIELTRFQGCAAEMEMVGYFLNNATVLKKLSINSCVSSSKKKLEITKKLLTLPRRGSTECPIIFN